MDYRLQDLIDVPMFQALLDRLNDVYVFPSAIIDNEGRVLTATAWQEVCTRFHRVHPSCERECKASDRYILDHIHEANPAVTYHCPHGLVDNAMPIVAGGHHLASFFTGQIFLQAPDLQAFRRRAADCGFDESAYLAAVAKVPVWSSAELGKHLDFIKGLVEIIQGVAEKNLREAEARRTIATQEEALAVVTGRLQLATASARAGVWDWNLVTGDLTWDARMFELYGVTPETFPGGVAGWERGLHPADRARAVAECQVALAGEREFDTEFRVKRPDGTVIVVHANGLVLRDPEGRALRMIGLNTDITARKQAEEELRESRESLALALRSSEMGVWRLDLRTHDRHFDALVCRCLGLDDGSCVRPEEFQRVVHPDDRPRLHAALQKTIATGAPYEVEYRVLWPDGSLHHVAARARLARDEAGDAQAVSGLLWDITERKRAEEEKARLETQLQQAQRMESVGRLAGGVAHDFNNMLSVILGTADMAIKDVAPTEPLHNDLAEIRQAAERAAALTRQLLAFARRQTIAPEVVNLNEVVSGMLKMLGRLIGEDISLRWHPAAGLWRVKLDPSQVDQVLANLCVNARDAIDGVGQVTVETANATFDEAYCVAHAGFLPGDYVRLVVSDNGRGIDRDTLPLVFEPFFTTKAMGQGTGLGLATVYGIVKQNNGFVNVYSEPGQGTTFAIYLPRHQEVEEPALTARAIGQSRGGCETILLVEDEPAILKMSARILQQRGYSVLTAPTPGEAIRLARARAPGAIHLLLTDVVMPEMNGRDLARQIVAAHPDIKCLFTSGYTANVIAHSGVLDEGLMFIEKPFSPDRLAAMVRQALDRS